MTPVRVLVVDDQAVFRDAVRALVASTPGFELAGEAADGLSALGTARQLDPDLVLLDIRMPGLDGIETARRLVSTQPRTVVVLVTGNDIEDVRTPAEASGAAALLPKERLRAGTLRELWAAHGAERRTVAPG